jgi:hypothetical protein
MGGQRSFTGGIAYSANENGDDSSFNESISVNDDGYSLFLRPLGMEWLPWDVKWTVGN